jgi:carbon dioxide concentrating mechanism protein CcmM
MSKNGSLLAYNPVTTNVHYSRYPNITSNVFIGSNSVVIGDVTVKGPAFIGFNNVIRADYGSPFFIGPRTSIHDQCLINGQPNRYIKFGNTDWSVYIEGDVSILHGSTIHGPCRIGKNTFIGQKVSIYDAQIKPNCVIMHGANISGGIIVPEGRFVESGKSIFRQADADELPLVPAEYLSLNPETVNGYMELMEEYLSQTELGNL